MEKYKAKSKIINTSEDLSWRKERIDDIVKDSVLGCQFDDIDSIFKKNPLTNEEIISIHRRIISRGISEHNIHLIKKILDLNVVKKEEVKPELQRSLIGYFVSDPDRLSSFDDELFGFIFDLNLFSKEEMFQIFETSIITIASNRFHSIHKGNLRVLKERLSEFSSQFPFPKEKVQSLIEQGILNSNHLELSIIANLVKEDLLSDDFFKKNEFIDKLTNEFKELANIKELKSFFKDYDQR